MINRKDEDELQTTEKKKKLDSLFIDEQTMTQLLQCFNPQYQNTNCPY